MKEREKEKAHRARSAAGDSIKASGIDQKQSSSRLRDEKRTEMNSPSCSSQSHSDRTTHSSFCTRDMTTRHALTLLEKVELIRDSEEKISYRVLAEKYKISVGSVSNIIKRKAEYIESYEQNDSSTKKRSRRNDSSERVDRLVYEWFVLQRSKNIPITGPLLQERARQIRQQLGGPGVDDFKASNGWLEKFRSRHNIKSRILCGEAATVDCTTVDEWKKRLPSIIDNYDPNDVYNADESGLFFKALPTRSLVSSKEACKGGKRSKERFTILLCTNMTGKHKLKPLLIAKFSVFNRIFLVHFCV